MAGTPLVELLEQAKADELYRDDDVGLCQSLKKGRVQCHNRTGKHLGFCRLHRNQEIQRQPEIRKLKIDEEFNEQVLLESPNVDRVRESHKSGNTEDEINSSIRLQALGKEPKQEPNILNKPPKRESPHVRESEVFQGE